MLVFKSFPSAAGVIRDIELAEKIKKGQFKVASSVAARATMPEIWRACISCLSRVT